MAKARIATSPKSKSLSHKSHKNPQKKKWITSIHALGMHHPTLLCPLVFLVAILSAPRSRSRQRLDEFSTQDSHILSSNLQSSIANHQSL
jgi:hypothetical protein